MATTTKARRTKARRPVPPIGAEDRLMALVGELRRGLPGPDDEDLADDVATIEAAERDGIKPDWSKVGDAGAFGLWRSVTFEEERARVEAIRGPRPNPLGPPELTRETFDRERSWAQEARAVARGLLRAAGAPEADVDRLLVAAIRVRDRVGALEGRFSDLTNRVATAAQRGRTESPVSLVDDLLAGRAEVALLERLLVAAGRGALSVPPPIVPSPSEET